MKPLIEKALFLISAGILIGFFLRFFLLYKNYFIIVMDSHVGSSVSIMILFAIIVLLYVRLLDQKITTKRERRMMKALLSEMDTLKQKKRS
tara:strand:- start:50 stop:322 length:273 start_codon:yes stop_codon:yes gene_type:complete